MEQANLFDLPDHSTLYAALVARNPDYEGRAYVGVTSTGIFCRLTCSARKPKSENCRFFATVQHCLEAGFRPCKRCQPMQALPDGEKVIIPMFAALEQEPLRQWSERDIEQMGFDPSTVRRAFQRHFGRSFLEMARQRRLQEGIDSLDAGNRVIFAQIDAGFSSASGFRRAFAQLLGCPPSALRKDASLRASQISTPLGDMIAISSASHLHLLEFMDRKALPTELGKLSRNTKGDLGLGRFAPTEQIQRELDDFFALKSAHFDTPLFMQASPFTQAVWRALGDIPAGQTRSYSDIAQQIGRPNAVRAVARANGANQIALAIPCHRVIGADGRLTGYGGGLWRKQRLIEIEHAYSKKGK